MESLGKKPLKNLLKKELYWILFRVLAIVLLQAFLWLLVLGDWLSYLGALQSVVRDLLQKIIYSLIVVFLLQAFNRFFVPTVRKLFSSVVSGFAKEPLIRRRMLKNLERYTTYFGYLIAILALLAIWYSRMGPWLANFLTNTFILIMSFMIGLFTSSVLGNVLAYWTLNNVIEFKKGDRIQIGDAFGDVIDFGFFFVKIRTSKNEVISIPNLKVVENGLINYSALDTVLIHIPITLSYELDREKVEEILIRSAMKTEGIIHDENKKPFVLILDIFYTAELGRNAVTYEINAYTDRPNDITKIRSKLIENMLEEFKKCGIKI